jgi:hypothetical protein
MAYVEDKIWVVTYRLNGERKQKKMFGPDEDTVRGGAALYFRSWGTVIIEEVRRSRSKADQ